MKIFLLIILIFFVAGCDLIKPLPVNNTITFGKEGIGIDKLADKVMEKADKVKNYIDNFKTGEYLKENKSKLGLNGEEEYADLVAATDTGGKGTATRVYSEGQFALEVISELPLCKEGYFYECWLAMGEPINYISVGKLIRETDGKYHLKFIINNNYTDYNNVVITLETDDGDSTPAATVLQGKFTE